MQADEKSGLAALNEVVINALGHVPACLEFLECLDNEKIFRFCAIPQLMAIATLKELYNNPEVLHKNVKMRKGRTAKYFMAIQDFNSTKKEFISILKSLEKKDATGKIIFLNCLYMHEAAHCWLEIKEEAGVVIIM